MIYIFGEVYFPGILQGFAFFALAVIYTLVSFAIVQKIGIETMKSEEKYSTIFYSIAAI